MKQYIKYIFIALIFTQILLAQERIVMGKVLDEGLTALPGVQISHNSKVLMTTDLDGKFELKLTPEIKLIEINFLGCQDEKVIISVNCNYYGIILLNESTYCFMTQKKAERKKKRHRKIIPKLYEQAYEKKLFDIEKSCL